MWQLSGRITGFHGAVVGLVLLALFGGLVPARGAQADEAALRAAGLVKKAGDGIRLLAKGELKTKITIIVDHASEAARKAVEALGGVVQLREASPKNSGDEVKRVEEH